jgi:hypothetical protein
MSLVKDTLKAAMLDIALHGFDPTNRAKDWQYWLLYALLKSTPKPKAKDKITNTFVKETQYSKLKKNHKYLKEAELNRISYKFHDELANRIKIAEDIVDLHIKSTHDDIIRRFIGWASSIPSKGTDGNILDKRKVEASILKPESDLKRKETLVIEDQKRKMITNINDTVAKDTGAIGATWHSNFRQAGYNFRPEHKERDISGKVFIIADNWAEKEGLLAKYKKETEPGEEPNCKCHYKKYIYKLNEFPPEMLTKKGLELI